MNHIESYSNFERTAKIHEQLYSCLALSRMLYALGLKRSKVGAAHEWLRFARFHGKL